MIAFLIRFLSRPFLPLQRGDNVPKVLVFSVEGYFLYSWNETVEMPHGIFVLNTAKDSSVWITDVGTGMYGGAIRSIEWGRKYCRYWFKLLIYLSLSNNSEADLCFTCHEQTSQVLHKIR